MPPNHPTSEALFWDLIDEIREADSGSRKEPSWVGGALAFRVNSSASLITRRLGVLGYSFELAVNLCRVPSGDARLPAPAEKRAVTSQVAQAGGRFIRDAGDVTWFFWVGLQTFHRAVSRCR
jgi:hypothetical protein